jgi:hypothetical protein
MADVFQIPAGDKDASPAFQIPPGDKDSSTGFQIPEGDKDFNIPAGDKVSDQAISLLDSTPPEDLAKNPDFRPTDFYNQYKDILTPAQVDKLGQVYEQVTGSPSRITVGGAVQAAGSGLKSFGKGAVKFAWDAPSILFGEDPDEVKNNPNPGSSPGEEAQRLQEAQDAQKAKAEALAGLESASASTANLARTGLRKLFNLGFRWGSEHVLGIPVDAEADIAKGPESFTKPVDWTQRLIDDAAVTEWKTRTRAVPPVGQCPGRA